MLFEYSLSIVVLISDSNGLAMLIVCLIAVIVIHRLQNILSESESIKCLTDVPYFDGDFWPNELENIIIEDEKDEKKEMKEVNGDCKLATEVLVTYLLV